MMEELAHEEVDQYLEENSKIVPLSEIYAAEIIAPYIVEGEIDSNDNESVHRNWKKSIWDQRSNQDRFKLPWKSSRLLRRR